MKALFLNLPHKDKIIRRYMCSYNSPIYLFPPYELLQLASCVKARNGAEVVFLDAVAEDKSEQEVADFIAKVCPNIVVSITGIESIATDLGCIDRLKADNSRVTFVIFGYYPTIFSEEILLKSYVDVILRNEPEEAFLAYLSAIKNKQDISQIPGIALRCKDNPIIVNPEKRITNLDKFPLVDYSFVDVKKYSEMLLGGPLGVIESARGCPFSCSYCITSHGRKLIYKSAERVVQELKHLVASGVRVVRFIDDTFMVNKKRVEEICRGILREKIRVRWSCLSRVDTLEEEILRIMKRSGCIRVYVGIESYSQRVCDYFKKRYDCTLINKKLQLLKKVGLESVGFIMVGFPSQQQDDFTYTLEGVLNSPLDFVVVTKLVPYPGTLLYEQMKSKVNFNLIPYEDHFSDSAIDSQVISLEKQLYKKFYFRPKQALRLLRICFSSPYQSIRLFIPFMNFLMRRGEEKEHPDFL